MVLHYIMSNSTQLLYTVFGTQLFYIVHNLCRHKSIMSGLIQTELELMST
jgi:hypothetical protein